MEVNTKKRLKVPRSVRTMWTENRSHGDFQKLLGKLDCGERALRDALNKGEATAALQQNITAAFVALAQERKAAEKELEKQQLAALKNA